NLGIIQKTISFQTQVMSLYQKGLQLAMMGATEAGKGMMQASLELAKALEDGIVTDEEKKKILEMLGVQFNETGKPVINLKDIMKSFEDQVKDNINRINELRKALAELDGLESHIYIYRHEITVKGTKATATEEEAEWWETEYGMHHYQRGAWYVPRNMPAYLHKGEMVLPRRVAEWFRRGGIAASQKIVNIHVNVNASGVSDPKELADIIERELARRWRAML
ncbi:MAG: hypothetical protein J7L83_00455, partial [Thaumarchaeota archaeon]|nr:hypothetical protein [Nitrososphaerota archaeon]